MTISLSVSERIVLLSLLPVESNLATLRQVRGAQEALGFADAEAEALKVTTTATGLSWSPEHDVAKDVNISAVLLALLLKRFEELSTSNKLPLSFLSVYERLLAF